MNPFCCIRTIKDVSTFSFIFPVLWYLLIATFALGGIEDLFFGVVILPLRTITECLLVLIHAISMGMLSKTLQSCVGASAILSPLLSTLVYMPMVTFIMLLLSNVEPEFVVTTYIFLTFGVLMTTTILRACMVWTPHRYSFYFTIFNDAIKSVI